MSFEDAATFGVGVASAGQALYMTLKPPLPTEPANVPSPILIYRGSTATGTLAIQYAKLYVLPSRFFALQLMNLIDQDSLRSPQRLLRTSIF